MIRHYLWAGLDFMLDAEGVPVLLEANRSSHMLGEYIEFHGDERPFELTARAMESADGPACLLWRRGDPFPDADEDACYIGGYLAKHLHEPPVVCHVEDNQVPAEELTAKDGGRVRPGSVFRWWYGLPWSYERSGVRVINPNSVWVAVRDKLACYQTLAEARTFRVPRAFPVESPAEVRQTLEQHADLFASGYVLKPRVGWGGFGVQVGESADPPREFAGGYLLSERIRPPLSQGRYWDVRAFVFCGEYLGGVQYSSYSPVTNWFQGGRADRLDSGVAALIGPAALEAVERLDAAAELIHALPQAPVSPLTNVEY